MRCVRRWATSAMTCWCSTDCVSGFDGSPDRLWIAAEHGWFMFHFMIRSFDQLRSKVINGGRAFQDTRGLETHGGHWKARYERYEREGDRFIETLLTEHVRSVADGGWHCAR